MLRIILKHLLSLFVIILIGATALRLKVQDQHIPLNISHDYGRFPLSFVANRGQSGDNIRYLASGPGYTLGLTPTEAILGLQIANRGLRNVKPLASAILNPISVTHNPESAILRFKLQGANPAPGIEAQNELSGKVNYFIGNDSKNWLVNVPTYAKIRYTSVYPGIDVVYYGNQRQLEYDFVVAPGADPQAIKLSFDGADKINLDAQGNLDLHLGGNEVRQHKPVIYQVIDGERNYVSGEYVITGDQQVAFQLGEYDKNLSLVIDPVLSYSTYFGGSGATESPSSIAVDSAGQVYVIGSTGAADFPTSNPAQGTLKGSTDAFVTKLNAAGNAMVYSTFLGGRLGTQSGEIGFGIAVDGAGNAYVTGATLSTDFPTVKPFQSTLSGPADAFVTKLSPNGSIVFSTYLGGSGAELGFGIAVDTLGTPYITGTTSSADLLSGTRRLTDDEGENTDALAGPEQTGLQGQSDAFVIKLAPTGDARIYGRYVGGGGPELGLAITVDFSGSAYLSGLTTSTNFPTVNPFQPNFGGGDTDGFVTKVAVNGGSLVYSSYLGGNGNENFTFLSQLPFTGLGIAVDSAGNAIVSGTTDSTNFPTKNAVRPQFGGVSDAYVTKINAAGNDLVYSTYLGGDNEELGFGVAVDAAGNAYAAGSTTSTNFPTANPLQGSLKGTIDGFITKLTPAGTLVYSTYFGGNKEDFASGIAADAAGNAYIFGLTTSGDYPTQQALQPSIKGEADTFITKISDSGGPPTRTVTTVSAASYLGQKIAMDSLAAAFGTGLATRFESAGAVLPLPTQIAGTTVRIRDSVGFEMAAPLFVVSPGQINFHVLPFFSAGNASVTVTSGDGQVSTGNFLISRVAPGLFSADTSGTGLAAAVVLRLRGNGSLVYEPVVVLDSSNRYVAVPIDLGPLSDQVFLILFGTGMKLGTAGTLRASIGGTDGQIFYNGPSGYIGLDQCNVLLPRILGGRGEVNVTFSADGETSNAVKVVMH